MSKNDKNKNLGVSSNEELENVTPVTTKRVTPVDPDMPELKIDNSVDENSTEKYIAWCSFTTLKKNDEGRLVSTQVEKGDIITPAQVPQVWIEQAVAQRYLLSQKDKDSLNNDDLRKLGYTVSSKKR